MLDTVISQESLKKYNIKTPQSRKLGELQATAICGNDITSSCLYVTALALLWAGPLAPLSLLMVAGLLWLFRGIYSEVVGALPLNGGAYNALLNTTSKYRASLAACLTILSYLATAVISSTEAVHYMGNVVESFSGYTLSEGMLNLLTVGVLALFALLTIIGIKESANVATAIFLFHLSVLGIIIVLGGVSLIWRDSSVFLANISSVPPVQSSHPLLFGFAVSLLGISGFESSANYVEEQQEGIFPKTLRNMWIAVTTLNISICFLALYYLPMSDIPNYKTTLLAQLAEVIGTPLLALIISVDAAIVLCGAVLTSFVSVTGLVHRMTLDRCLPQSLLKLSRFGTYHRIILSFFALSSLLIFVAGNVETLAGVYTISFLSVMALFTVGNMLLKIKRNKLPRDVRVSWLTIIIAFIGVSLGIAVNVYMNPKNIEVFLLYFIPTVIVVTVMLERTVLLKILLYILRSVSSAITRLNNQITLHLERMLNRINSQTVVFFTRGDNIANLNKAMLYIKDNESTNRIKVVTVVPNKEDVPKTLKRDLEFLDAAYPSINIEFVVIEGEFSPALLKQLSEEWKIPLNFMFIGSPGDHFPHNLSELGGVRLII